MPDCSDCREPAEKLYADPYDDDFQCWPKFCRACYRVRLCRALERARYDVRELEEQVRELDKGA